MFLLRIRWNSEWWFQKNVHISVTTLTKTSFSMENWLKTAFQTLILVNFVYFVHLQEIISIDLGSEFTKVSVLSVSWIPNFILERISLTLLILWFFLCLVKMSNGNRGIFRFKKEDTDCRGILQWREIFWKWCLENWIKKSSGFIQLFRWFAWKANFAFFCQIIFEGISVLWLGTRLSRIFCFQVSLSS